MTTTTSWYKVVRPDLASFVDPSFKYRIGHARLPKTAEERMLCRPGLLHASPSPELAALNGHWPYRLLSVEGEPVMSQPDKSGFLRLLVVEELPARLCWGPSGVAVERVIRRIESCTAEEVKAFAAAWDAAGYAARDAAWAAGYAARDAVGDAVWDVVGNAVWDAVGNVVWDAAGYAARDAAWDAGYAARDAVGGAVWDVVGNAVWDAVWDAVGNAVWDAARDAAWAAAVSDLVGRHDLTRQHIDTLLSPWRSAFNHDPLAEDGVWRP